MKCTTKFLLTLALAAAVSSDAASSRAQKSDIARPATLRTSTASNPTPESWWGRGAAIGCGLWIHNGYFPMLGGSFCIIALLDAIT